MERQLLDFRSDTVTKPTQAMRRAMAEADVGDDVFGEDPTINRLQERVAEMLGKEAAVYVPSGSMSNQIGVRLHCAPGDEFICEAGCHIYNYEQGAFAQLSGVVARTLTGEYGVLRREQLEGQIRPDNEHLVRTRLVCLENTHNRGSGRIQPYDEVESICDWAHANGLRTHLDGARLFNAAVASRVAADRWARHFDTVSVCFSKGLGAPVGSALAGPRDLMVLARRHRKLFGGTMRQAGVIAAGALYALEHHVDRLAEDHANAQRLAEIIRSVDELELRPRVVDTNIVIFAVNPQLGTANEFATALKERGLLMLSVGPQLIRAVTHLDVNGDDVERAGEILRESVRVARKGGRRVSEEAVVY
ncbi:MAG: GntG family PLP-dependent aldolase [Pirellulales bacterium]